LAACSSATLAPSSTLHTRTNQQHSSASAQEMKRLSLHAAWLLVAQPQWPPATTCTNSTTDTVLALTQPCAVDIYHLSLLCCVSKGSACTCACSLGSVLLGQSNYDAVLLGQQNNVVNYRYVQVVHTHPGASSTIRATSESGSNSFSSTSRAATSATGIASTCSRSQHYQ
jgi:hypothetical protein